MPEYHPPLASRNALRLDFNENTLAPSPRVLAKLREITAEGLTIYPEREPVEHIVAQHHGLDRNQLILTNGVDEAIHLMACAFLDEGDEALICTPTFFMYDVSIGMMTSRLDQGPDRRLARLPLRALPRRHHAARPSSSSSPRPTTRQVP